MSTPERAELVREAWRRCRHHAIHHFAYAGGMAWRAEIPRELRALPHDPVASARFTVEVFTFIHETARDHPLAPQKWRVVCEGITLEMGVYDG